MTAELDALKKSIDQALHDQLPQNSDLAPSLVEAMRYAVLGGGKRLRPLFVCASCEAAGGTAQQALPAACAVEFVHAYSLVHDDLPAMDDDELRHGKPATHVAFGEADAILAGDALLTLAFEQLADLKAPAEVTAQCIRLLARSSGWTGMVGGQSLDMLLPGLAAEDVPIQRLEQMHAAKSGALIHASVQIGATIGGASATELKALGQFANLIGLAFQIQDDVLDATSNTEVLGKPAGSDEAAGKHTFVRHIGIAAARERARTLLDEGLALLNGLGFSSSLLDPQGPESHRACVKRSSYLIYQAAH